MCLEPVPANSLYQRFSSTLTWYEREQFQERPHVQPLGLHDHSVEIE